MWPVALQAIYLLSWAEVILGRGIPVEPPSSQASRCGDTTYVPYTPTTVVRAPLKSYPIKSRCSHGNNSFGDQLLVTTTFTADTTWMAKHIPIPYLVYHAGNKDANHSHPNWGNEAMGYLTFIAEYYDCLPEVTLFAHPHRNSWHSSRDLDYNIRRIRWDAVPGFAVLHRQGMWWEQHVRDTSFNLAGQANYTKAATADCTELLNNTAYNGDAIDHFWRGEWIAMAWNTFFEPAGLGSVPDFIRCSVSAEFLVTRERIHAHPREFYLQAIQWLIASKEEIGLSSYEVGCVFENTWHIIFGEPANMAALTIPECQLYVC